VRRAWVASAPDTVALACKQTEGRGRGAQVLCDDTGGQQVRHKNVGCKAPTDVATTACNWSRTNSCKEFRAAASAALKLHARPLNPSKQLQQSSTSAGRLEWAKFTVWHRRKRKEAVALKCCECEHGAKAQVCRKGRNRHLATAQTCTPPCTPRRSLRTSSTRHVHCTELRYPAPQGRSLQPCRYHPRPPRSGPQCGLWPGSHMWALGNPQHSGRIHTAWTRNPSPAPARPRWME
jgi:hypothetical protein